MIVLKFSGTSVGNPTSVQQVITLIKRSDAAEMAKANGRHIAVIFSALAGVTNHLLKLGQTAEDGGDWEQEFAALTQRRLDAITELVAAPQQPRVCAHVTDMLHVKTAVNPVDINVMAGALVDAGWAMPLPFSLGYDSSGVVDNFHADDVAGAFKAGNAVSAVN